MIQENEKFTPPVQADISRIKGWGIDADPKNDPTYPMKKRSGDVKRGYNWERPPQQPMTVEILHSIERPNLTAVFGTSVPPSGISGKIRRKAFEHSENSYGHWVPLILADRINMMEGIVDDLKQGTFPNFFKEFGWTAEWKYNRKNFLAKTAVFAGTVAVAVMLMNKRKCDR